MEEKYFFRSKAVLHATDMSRKLPSLQKTKSMRYLWYVGPGWPRPPPSPLPPHSTCAGHHGPLLGHRSAENATHLCARS